LLQVACLDDTSTRSNDAQHRPNQPQAELRQDISNGTSGES
jgi:hypothetical protein